ncbi:MAG: adenylate/guanylate cyclase domain-containing protein [Cyanobacteria bacterium P01_A01_bin.105]
MTDIDSSAGMLVPAKTFSVANSQLSPGIAYYIRRLLRQNLDRLVTADASPIHAALLHDIEALVQNASSGDVAATMRQLDDLAQEHQALNNQGLKQREELRATEQQIVQLLGLSLKENQQQATLLIVDDTPDNLRLLSTALREHGYTVRSAINGALALSSAQMIKPDLILLDIMMPGLNGYEVCERLKADPKTSDIPIIFISAVDAALDKVKAFNVGGVDYISKPFQIEEVLVRIHHQLKIWNLQKRLEDQSLRYQQEIGQRQQADERSRQLFERALNGTYQLAPDGHFLEVSAAMAELYSYASPAALCRMTTAPALYTDARRFNEFVNRLQVEDWITDFESEIQRADGTTVWVSETARAVRNERGNLLYYEGVVQDISARKEAEAGWRRGRRRTKRLLMTLFPKVVAQQFGKRPEESFAHQFDRVTVLFADLMGLNPLAINLPPVDFLALHNQIFYDFNRLAEPLNIEPIKTLGNRYMAICGAPTAHEQPAVAMAHFASELQKIMADYQLVGTQRVRLKVGLCTGPVVAGIIGKKKLSYDVWGKTVTLASELTRLSQPGKIQVDAATYAQVKATYRCDRREDQRIENEPVVAYWLQGSRSSPPS